MDEEDGGEEDEMAVMMKQMVKMKKGCLAKNVTANAISNGGNIILKRDDSTAYKAVKRFLTKGEGHDDVLTNAMGSSSSTDDHNESATTIVIPRPQLIMGTPYGKYTPKSSSSSQSNNNNNNSTTSPQLIAEEDGATNTTPLSIKTMPWMESRHPMLNSKKKAMTILPEEAVGLLIAQVKKSVRDEFVKDFPESDLANDSNNAAGGEDGEEEGDSYMDFPPAFAIPGWATLDSTVEALIDAAGSSSGCGPSLHQRSIAACVGALVPPVGKAAQDDAIEGCGGGKGRGKEAALARRDPAEVDPFVPLVLLVGVTNEGIEMTAVQITKPQGPDKELHCPFGNINVISSVCYAMSEALAKAVTSVLTKYGKEGENSDDYDGWDEDIPIVSTGKGCVSMGLAVLAASVHGRVKLVVSVKGTDGKLRPKAKLGVSVQDVATCAVAVSFNYYGGAENKWTEPKVIFDFDRRVPAGPYQIDFTAAECAAHLANGGKGIEDESELIEKAKNLEGSRGIPDREAAALKCRFRLYQKTSRGGGDDDSEWIRLGNDMKPLSMEHSQKDEGESGDDNMVAIESAVLEISLSSVGIITTKLITNGETIVQATKSARNSKLLRWGTIIGSVLFIGGFLVKSYVEERIFDRDTQRVLAYYKHAAANSFHDGDERQARYLVWKYKGKKDALWRRLEAKYGVPVKHAWEWDDEEEDGSKDDDEAAEDLDGEGEEDEVKGEEL
ncbi:hypothetical protein QTG54_005673 [Skeletonema marinoi]|uniref:Uncharacterized protein n=1 Tax=Skeletonema marinoi TaxID=267567 RepID=A0AAD8YF54_9STRA|nr:hypothetical protein QTG54_005673 [Skeletonema marinoi]